MSTSDLAFMVKKPRMSVRSSCERVAEIKVEDFFEWVEGLPPGFKHGSAMCTYRERSRDAIVFHFVIIVKVGALKDQICCVLFNTDNMRGENLQCDVVMDVHDGSGNSILELKESHVDDPLCELPAEYEFTLGPKRWCRFISLIELKNCAENKDALTFRCRLWAKEEWHDVVGQPWPFKKLSADLAKLFELSLENQGEDNPSFTDFRVICEENVVFNCHRAILASRSDVFHRMLTSDMEESLRNEVKIQDFSPQVVKSFLQFIYTGSITDRDVDCCELLLMADKYNVEDLVTVCSKAVSTFLKKDNCLEILSAAYFISCQTLVQESAAFVKANYQELRQSDEWKTFVKENPRALEAILDASIPDESRTFGYSRTPPYGAYSPCYYPTSPKYGPHYL